MKLLFNFFCRDIEAQLRFYQELLGLPESVHSRSAIFRAVETEHFQFGFHAQPAYDLLGLRQRAPAAPSPQPLTGYPTFMLQDHAEVDRLAARVTELGGHVIQGPYPTYYGQWQAVLADPEDNVFRIGAQDLPAGVTAPPLQVAESSAASALPGEVALDERDGTYLMRAIAWSRTGRERGNRPFGAVVVSDDGEVLAEAWCNGTETGDCTGHAEMMALRQVSPQVDRETLARATIYSSAEPCVMCAGAIFWSNIRRVVYGIDAVRLRVFRGERPEQRDAELSCRDVFAASPHLIECVGPALIEAASAPHIGVWRP